MNEFQKKLNEYFKTVDLDIDINDSYDDYDIYKEIRDAIIYARNEKEMTQSQLSSRTGLTQASISKIEKGLSKPSIDSLKKIADATGKRLIIDLVEREELF